MVLHESGVTREEYEAYEDVRSSGVTNMFDMHMVIPLSGLSKERILAVMKNYISLSEYYR